MADTGGTVCSMCGDVGFSEKLFHCTRCLLRFQHSYCSNYYEEKPSANTTTSVCDWCLVEERNRTKHEPPSKKHATASSSGRVAGSGYRSSGDNKAKKHSSSDDQEDSGSRGKNSGTSSSSKTGGRRYKLLKDVLY